MPSKRKRESWCQLLDIWHIDGVMQSILSYLLFENHQKNVMLFKVLFQVCQKIRRWSQMFFADVSCPSIRDERDKFFWQYYLPNMQQISVPENSSCSFIFQFQNLRVLEIVTRGQISLSDLNLWTCDLVEELSIPFVSICQQTLTRLSKKLIHLKRLRVCIKDDNFLLLISQFQKLEKLSCAFSNQKNTKILLQDLPMLKKLSFWDEIELLQINNVPMLECLRSLEKDIHHLVFLSPLPHLTSIFLDINLAQFQNLDYLSLQNLTSFSCVFDQHIKSICDQFQNITSLKLTQMDFDVDVAWGHYEKLTKIGLCYPTLASFENLFQFQMLNVTTLDLHWYGCEIDFANLVLSFPNLKDLSLYWDNIDYTNFQSIFQLQNLTYFFLGAEYINEEDVKIMKGNIKKCLQCDKDAIIRTTKSCSLCSFIVCIVCAQKSLVCKSCINLLRLH